jgi:hypothetical protein
LRTLIDSRSSAGAGTAMLLLPDLERLATTHLYYLRLPLWWPPVWCAPPM